MQLTTRETVAITLARDTTIDPAKLASIVKRLHASASIIRDTDDDAVKAHAEQRAAFMLKGTGWAFDATDSAAPAIVKGGTKIVLH